MPADNPSSVQLPPGVERTGRFLPPANRALVVEAIQRAQRTPVILVGGVDASASAWRRAQELLHRFALDEGLPEIVGFYGYDDTNGEILGPT